MKKIFTLLVVILFLGTASKLSAQMLPCYDPGVAAAAGNGLGVSMGGPVCGCDGNTYTDDTDAVYAGITHFTFDQCGFTSNCHADFTYSHNGFDFYFIDSSTFLNSPEYSWDFMSDTGGDWSMNSNPIYTFPHGGYFTVRLVINDSITGCQSLTTRIISVDSSGAGCNANFTMYPDTTTLHNWFALNLATGTAPITYNWSWGDGGTGTGATPSHVYSAPGYYPICLTITDSTGCTSTYCDSSTYISRVEEEETMISVSVVMSLPNGVNTVNSSTQNISISPNPANEKLFIHSSKQNITASIQLFNRTGQLVFENKNFTSENIDTKNLQNGFYVLKYSTDGNYEVKKFLVQH